MPRTVSANHGPLGGAGPPTNRTGVAQTQGGDSEIRLGFGRADRQLHAGALLTDTQWQRVGDDLALAPRELELVRQIFDGKKLLAAALAMRLSLGTVKTYAQRAYRKLGVRDQRELVLAVIEAHLRLTCGSRQPVPLQEVIRA